MNNGSFPDTQRQLTTETADTTAPSVAASREAADIGFEAALDALREGIDGYGDRIHASAAVLRAVNALAVPADLLSHPRIEQSIWRYEHDHTAVRDEIRLTLERENNGEIAVDEVVAAYRVAAVRLDTPLSTT